MRDRAVIVILAVLAACGTPKNKTEQTFPATELKAPVARPATEQIPPVEFGRRPPGTRMTSANMPFFDTVTYCDHATRSVDKIRYGPAYEACVEYQDATRVVLGEAIDANKFDEADIIRCAKASRTAYEGLWYCLNGKPY